MSITKKIRNSAIASLAALTLAASSYAAPIGNPSEPKFSKGKIGMTAEMIYDSVSKQEFSYPDEKINMKVDYNLAKVGVNFFRKLQIYGIVGQLRNGVIDETKGSDTLKYYTKDSSINGGGATIIVFDRKGWTGAFDAKYLKSKPELKKTNLNGIDYEVTSSSGNLETRQATLGISKELRKGKLIPYIAGGFSETKMSATGIVNGEEHKANETKSKDKWIAGAGMTCRMTKNVSLNLEARAGAEQAVTGKFTLSF